MLLISRNRDFFPIQILSYLGSNKKHFKFSNCDFPPYFHPNKMKCEETNCQIGHETDPDGYSVS